MGKSSKVITGYEYRLGVQLSLGIGPKDSLTEFIYDERTAWAGSATYSQDIGIDAVELFGGEPEGPTFSKQERSAGPVGTMTVNMGDQTIQDPYLVEHVSEHIPLFRGLCTLLFKKFLWSSGAASFKKPWFRTTRILKSWRDDDPWYPEKAQISTPLANPPNLSGNWTRILTTDAATPLPASDLKPPPPYGGVSTPLPFSDGSGTWPDLPTQTAVWAIKEFTTSDSVLLTIYIEAENSGHVYFDGRYLGSANPTNAQVTVIQTFTVTTTANAGTHFVQVLGKDEAGAVGSSGSTYLNITLTAGPLQIDMNPAHIIYQCLTDLRFGLGYSASDIDDDSFREVADVLYAEKFGLSFIWDQDASVMDFIQTVLDHINGNLRLDLRTGKYALKLIRDDYVINDLLELNPSNVITLDSFQRSAWGELVTGVTVVYTDTMQEKQTVQVQNLAALGAQSQQENIAKKEYLGIRNAGLAGRVALRDQAVSSNPLAAVSLTASRVAWDLDVGDVYALTWPNLGLSKVPFRITDVNRGSLKDGRIAITAVEDVFGLPTSSYVAVQESGWVDTAQLPAPPEAAVALEAPYWDIVRSMTAADFGALTPGYAFGETVALKPATGGLNYGYDLYEGATTAAYDYAAAGVFAPSAIVDAALNFTDNTDIVLSDINDLDDVEIGTYAIIESEYFSVLGKDLEDGTVTLGRGVLDTLPAQHAAGSRIYFAEEFLARDLAQYSLGITEHYKTLTRTSLGRLDISYVPDLPITFVGRADKPYPPGNLKVNGVSYPANFTGDLALTWAHRDRTAQTAALVPHSTGNIGPEVGVTYNLRIYSQANTLIRNQTGISADHYTYTQSQEVIDMGGLSGGLAVEPFWDKVVLLANMNGTNGSTVFIDSSPNFAIPNGNVHVTTSQLLFGSSVATFDGTGDYLNLPYVPNYDLGSSNFTIEYWFRPTTISVVQIHFEWRDANLTKGIVIYQSGGAPTKISAVVGDSNTSAWEVNIVGTTTLVVGTLYHVRLVKNGTNWQLYLGGVTQGSATSAVVPYLNSASIFFGAARDLSAFFNGQSADLRITKAARNTSGFTAPTTRLGKYERQANHSDFKALLTFEGANNETTIKDQSDLALPVTFYGNAKITTSQFKYGSSCLDLDGSYSSMVSVGDHPSQRGSGSNITIDCWIRTSDVTRAGTIASTGLPSTSNRAGWLIGMTNTGLLFARGFDDVGAEAFTILAATAISVNTWYHVELVRNGTTWTLYQGGVSIGSATELAILGVSNSVMCIGRDQNTLVTWLGQIDEFAIRDFAVDTTTFTPPTASYYPIDPYWSDVVVLMPMSGANNSTQFENIAEITKTLTASGNAQISTTQSKFGGASGLFDGNNDRLTGSISSSFGTGDFTIEGWFRREGDASVGAGFYQHLFDMRTAEPSTQVELDISGSTGGYQFGYYVNGTYRILGSTAALNVWNFVALVRSAGVTKLYVNGAQVGSSYTDTHNFTAKSYTALGRFAAASGDYRSFNGFADDLRVTLAARYPADFTPPTIELTKYVPAINSQLRFELESVRDGLVSYQKYDITLPRI